MFEQFILGFALIVVNLVNKVSAVESLVNCSQRDALLADLVYGFGATDALACCFLEVDTDAFELHDEHLELVSCAKLLQELVKVSHLRVDLAVQLAKLSVILFGLQLKA